jgi:hypothetical protein
MKGKVKIEIYIYKRREKPVLEYSRPSSKP